MTANPPPENLPQVLPPEEEQAATVDEGLNGLAEKETAWIEQSLSPHVIEAAALKNKWVKAYIDNLDADRLMRKTYAGRILFYLELYSAGVLVLLLLAGFKPANFSLEEGVMTALVGSTALAAIGLVGFIARGLFRPPPEPPSD